MIAADPRDTVWMARAFAALYASGASLVLATLALHGGDDRRLWPILAAAAVAFSVVALLFATAGRLSRYTLGAFPPLGTVLATVVVLSGGTDAVAAYAMIYFWVILATFVFFTPRAGALNLALVGASYAFAINVAQPPQGELRWVMGMGALSIAGLLVAILKGQVVRLLDQHGEHARQQESVARIGRHSLADTDPAGLARFAVEEVTPTVGAERTVILRRLDDGQGFVLEAAAGASSDSRPAMVVGAGDRFLDRALEARTAVFENSSAGAGGLPDGDFASRIAVKVDGGAASRVLLAHVCCARSASEAHGSFLEAVAALLGDAERRRRAEERLRQQALEDPLTGRPNRLLFVDRLSEACLRAPRSGRQVGVFVLGIDDFRPLNDGLGHRVGDEVLRRFAPRVRSALFLADTVARLGGDEFAILCEGLRDEREAVLIAQRVLESLREPFLIDGRQIRLSASMGFTVSDGLTDPEELVVRADAAMSRAKLQSRGSYMLFDETLRQRMRNRHQFEHALRGAASNGELQLLYQPIVSLDDGSCRGAEALLRWRHSSLGPVSPSEFIPVAEESGAILAIGEWVLREAFGRVACWRAGHNGSAPLPLHVNVSARQFAQRDFVEVIERTLAEAGADPADVAIELTEHALVHDLAAAAVTLGRLKEMGVATVLDDFGTGYSSLGHLKQLPIDVVKIDRLFVHQLETEERDAAIISAVLGIARAFSMQVVAEGVETPTQASQLRDLGCELAQGFLFGRPAPEPTLVVPPSNGAHSALGSSAANASSLSA